MIFDDLFSAIVQGDGPAADEHASRLLAAGMDPDDILHKHCIPATQEARQRVEQGIFYMPDLFIALRSYQIALEILQPHLTAQTYQQALGYGEFDITCHL
jgi:methanogenic corrinoid protein MtbC1